jgi:hypothetical protein
MKMTKASRARRATPFKGKKVFARKKKTAFKKKVVRKTKFRKKAPGSRVALPAGASKSTYTHVLKAPARAKSSTIPTNIHKFGRTFTNPGISGRMTGNFLPYWEEFTLAKFILNLYNQTPVETLPAGSSSVTNQIRPYMISCKGQMVWANASNSTLFLDIYDVHAKQTIGKDPVYCWSQGDTAEEAETGIASGVFLPGSKPTDSAIFRDNWGIDKITKISLLPGQQHVHYINSAPHHAKASDSIYSLELSGGVVQPYIQGITRGVMWTQMGDLAIDVGGTGLVTTTKTDSFIAVELNYRYSALKFPSTIITVDNTLGLATGTPTFENIATGQPLGAATLS